MMDGVTPGRDQGHRHRITGFGGGTEEAPSTLLLPAATAEMMHVKGTPADDAIAFN
jgi:hypothetical protein